MNSAGTILWLPPKQKIPSEHLLATYGIEEGCFDHPVVVLATDSAHKQAAVLIVTSFRGKDLLERFPRKRDKKSREIYIPIHPSNEHPDNGSCFFLADGERLSKNSYVKTAPVQIVKLGLLQSWNHGKCRLPTKSLRQLLKKIEFESPWPNVIQQHKSVVIPQPAPQRPPVHYQLPLHYQLPVQPRPQQPRYNQAPRAIACGSEYRVPGQWVSTPHSPVQVYAAQQRMPLLPRTHNTVRTSVKEPSSSSCVNFVFTLIFILIMLLVISMWYFGT